MQNQINELQGLGRASLLAIEERASLRRQARLRILHQPQSPRHLDPAMRRYEPADCLKGEHHD